MENISQMMTSIDQDWATPQYFVDLVEKKFKIKFDLDVCAYDHTAKAPKWFTEEDDALTKDWKGTCWMNPPYGQAIPKWLDYAYEQSKKHGSTIVCLVPARTDTVWFHTAHKRGSMHLLKGRIAFERAHGNDTEHKPGAFGSVLIAFGPNITKEKIRTWEWKNDLSRTS
jgi:phage N-6-adenine-methyltransferase